MIMFRTLMIKFKSSAFDVYSNFLENVVWSITNHTRLSLYSHYKTIQTFLVTQKESFARVWKSSGVGLHWIRAWRRVIRTDAYWRLEGAKTERDFMRASWAGLQTIRDSYQSTVHQLYIDQVATHSHLVNAPMRNCLNQKRRFYKSRACYVLDLRRFMFSPIPGDRKEKDVCARKEERDGYCNSCIIISAVVFELHDLMLTRLGDVCWWYGSSKSIVY